MTLLDASTLTTAFFAGLLGSGHCFGMCGGIALGLGSLHSPTGKASVSRPAALFAVLFNIGRIMSYATLGLSSAWVMRQTGLVLDIDIWGILLRLLTILLIFLIGLQFLFNWQLLSGIERMGALIWKQILPLAVRASNLPGGTGRLLLGLCWGLLPCGLVYSILLTASASGSPVSGALVMMAFGMGTLPSMLGMAMTAPAMTAILSDKWNRKLLGVALIVLALTSATLILVKTQDGGKHHHGQTSVSAIQIEFFSEN